MRTASELATSVTRKNENAGRSTTSAVVMSEMNWRILVFFHKLLTSRINYIEWESSQRLASKGELILTSSSRMYISQQVYSVL